MSRDLFLSPPYILLSRYPIVERAIAEVRMFSDPSFTSSIRTSAQRILREDKEKKSVPSAGSFLLEPWLSFLTVCIRRQPETSTLTDRTIDRPSAGRITRCTFATFTTNFAVRKRAGIPWSKSFSGSPDKCPFWHEF